MQTTLGGQRLGSGKKMQVDTQTFNRSTHDLSYILRTTMSAGTLVPFMCEVALPGDSINLNLNVDVLTLSTLGPLFGSYKIQLDTFLAPIRLYQGQLHNNKLGIGLKMSDVKLPVFGVNIPYKTQQQLREIDDLDNWQINPSCLLKYLGYSGFGIAESDDADAKYREMNAVPLLMYWDVFKQYYANKQEDNAYVISSGLADVPHNVTELFIGGVEITEITDPNQMYGNTPVNYNAFMSVVLSGGQELTDIELFILGSGTWVNASHLFRIDSQIPTQIACYFTGYTQISVGGWRYRANTTVIKKEIDLVEFPLKNIDEMRERILIHAMENYSFNVNNQAQNLSPYSLLFQQDGEWQTMQTSQAGLAVKTYQSDLFNNWLNTEYIDGVNGIAAVTAISTVNDVFTIDSLLLHKKVYDMLNDILISGGTYDNWNEVVYDHQYMRRAESPVYYGSLIKTLAFQEVISQTETLDLNGNLKTPLGQLAGRGKLNQNSKGGHMEIKVDEISYLMGIISITPHIEYSQGNEWHTSLKTMDDFHKPHMDQIGFQELITEQLAWWTTRVKNDGSVETKSAGKQPAWLNYMTNVNRVKGNFAIKDDSMFMVLTRRYNPYINGTNIEIDDLTTYIDPRHYNHIFSQTSLDSQNFWVQVGVDMEARRKISARIMPKL